MANQEASIHDLAVEELVRTTAPYQMRYLEAFVQFKDEMVQNEFRVAAYGTAANNVTLTIGKGVSAWDNHYTVENAPNYETAFRQAVDGMKKKTGITTQSPSNLEERIEDVHDLAVEELVRTTAPYKMRYLEAFVQFKDEMVQNEFRVAAYGTAANNVSLTIGKGVSAWDNHYTVENAPNYETAFRLAIDGMKAKQSDPKA